MKSPAFQFYPKDWLSDPNVIAMTATERGAYIQLLASMWLTEDCQLKDDPEYLSRIAQVDKVVITSLYPCFKVVNGWLRHKRLDQEREKQHEYRTKCSNAGKKGMKNRWSEPKNHKVVITNDNISSSSSITITEEAADAAMAMIGKKPSKQPSKLVHEWCRAYRDFFGKEYMVVPGKDEKGAIALAGLRDVPLEEILEMAKKAWGMPDGFNTKRAVSLSGFSNGFNEIRKDVGNLNGHNKSQYKPQTTSDVREQERQEAIKKYNEWKLSQESKV